MFHFYILIIIVVQGIFLLTFLDAAALVTVYASLITEQFTVKSNAHIFGIEQLQSFHLVLPNVFRLYLTHSLIHNSEMQLIRRITKVHVEPAKNGEDDLGGATYFTGEI